MASRHIFQIFLRVTIQNQISIAQRVIVDKIVQFRLLRHGHIQRILDPGAINGNFSSIPEHQLHAASVHVEMADSFIVLHVRVLSALRHSYSGLSCFLMIRSRTFFDGSKGFVLFSKEHKKSEPFSYREKVRIFIVWCTKKKRHTNACSPVDIPTGWEPRTKQQPTGLIAYPAAQGRAVQVLLSAQKKKRHTNVCLFLVQECNPNPNHFPRLQLLPLLQR